MTAFCPTKPGDHPLMADWLLAYLVGIRGPGSGIRGPDPGSVVRDPGSEAAGGDHEVITR